MRIISLLAAFLLLVVAAAAEPSSDDRKSEPVACTISSDPICELGSAPVIQVALINESDAHIYLVGSLDASDCRWRYPHCFFEVLGPDGEPAGRGGARCGNMNTLRTKDFVEVPPGAAFDPYQRLDDGGFFSNHRISPDTFSEPGVYRIRFVYSTNSDDIGEWTGDAGPALADNKQIVRLLNQVPKVEVQSNQLEVTVVGPDE